jgi:hypothetical protein
MAIMGRMKKANAQGWEAKNKERAKQKDLDVKNEEEKVSKEEHEKRMKILKEMGLLKE